MIANKLSPYDETKIELDENQENFINRKVPFQVIEFLKIMKNQKFLQTLLRVRNLLTSSHRGIFYIP